MAHHPAGFRHLKGVFMKDSDKKGFLKDLDERFKKLLPGDHQEGQPFWGLMESVKGKLTGSFFVIPGSSQNIKMALPLFFSKKEVGDFLASRSEAEKKKYVIRGLTKEQILLLTLSAKDSALFFMVHDSRLSEGPNWAHRLLGPEELKREFIQ